MIFQNITKNETLNSTKIAFRVITIIAITFFTFLNWFSQSVITVVMIRNFLANKSHYTSLYRTSFLNTVNFLIIFSKAFSTQWLIVLCSSFENLHGFFLTDLTNTFLEQPRTDFLTLIDIVSLISEITVRYPYSHILQNRPFITIVQII